MYAFLNKTYYFKYNDTEGAATETALHAYHIILKHY